MAEPEVRIEAPAPPADTEMGGDTNNEIVDQAIEALEAAGEETEETVEDETTQSQWSFIDYLKSPVVEIAVGEAEPVVLRAHQALLQRSPFFAQAIDAFSPDATSRRIESPSEDLAAVGSFLQYLYTGEYFPRRLGNKFEAAPRGAGTSEATAATVDEQDDSGEALLRHARIYTLAEKLGLGELKDLAHAKVHRVNSSARGELAYARYVYARTPAHDVTIRRPIAAFWGQRSHVLRHEAESEFRALCLDCPDFGFDVLSYVLDAREKRREGGGGRQATQEETPGRPGRKRARNQ